ncbi:hypothetical protein MF672_013110 [Actinomadura sp. ATCC 31491]|uniref:Glycoside hydrolase family 42 N-terminal domain-containing protein n=1 Tax=Actinomadura luzonensis TaxID=2805427 RepID=A0ABT0FQZ0_9ACTN|nr:hypothetical protein [Actinomadura luzonensis]MCK2214727.1 hypothetical protein [Actinomadura luzonensis]
MRGGRLLLAAAVIVVAVAVVWAVVGSSQGRSEAPRPSASRSREAGALPRVPWEGGPAYYDRFASTKAAGWTDPAFFPVGVWYESVITQDDVNKDREAGINTYVELTETSDLALIRNNGMFAIPSKPLPGYGQETVAWLITDEADMWAGPGDDGWTGNFPGQGPLCIPDDPHKERCGYTVMKTLKDKLPKDGRPHYANYGKGVMIYQNDRQAGRFVNDYTDLVSLDVYWYTSYYACVDAQNSLRMTEEQCRRSANYGLLIDRQRKLDAQDGKLQPVYAFVEVGRPAAEDRRQIEPAEVKGAVMSSLIHGARGVIYFNHSFGGPCQSQHVLRDGCGVKTRPVVIEVNAQIKRLAPVLNTQSLEYDFGPGVDTMLKEHQGAYYLFAMPSATGTPGAHTFALPRGLSPGQVEVLFENRRLPVDAGGRFTDTFTSESSYHVYRITAS